MYYYRANSEDDNDKLNRKCDKIVIDNGIESMRKQSNDIDDTCQISIKYTYFLK